MLDDVADLPRGRPGSAAVWLGFYSLSGLVGVGHFVDSPPGGASPSDFDVFQNTFIVLDIAAGVAVLAIAVHLWRHRGQPNGHLSPRTEPPQ